MRKPLLSGLLLIFILLAASGCGGPATTYRPLTDREIGLVISENHLSTLDIKNLPDTTLILYQTAKEVGHYYLAVDSKGSRIEQKTTLPNDPQRVPLAVGGVATGTPYVTAVINDPALQAKASAIRVTYPDGAVLEEEMRGRKGAIIVYYNAPQKVQNYRRVELVDATGGIIHSVP